MYIMDEYFFFEKQLLQWHKVSHWVIKFNPLRPRQNGRRSADDIFKFIFFNENVSILL